MFLLCTPIILVQPVVLCIREPLAGYAKAAVFLPSFISFRGELWELKKLAPVWDVLVRDVEGKSGNQLILLCSYEDMHVTETRWAYVSGQARWGTYMYYYVVIRVAQFRPSGWNIFPVRRNSPGVSSPMFIVSSGLIWRAGLCQRTQTWTLCFLS